MWQELFHIRLRFMKGITLERSHSIAQSVARDFHYQETWSTIRRSWKETTIEVQQKWQELFHIRWRFMKGITQERSHSIAQSVARASLDQNTKKYLKRIHEGKNHWSLRSFSTSRFMKGMTMERNNSSAWSVARASHDQETWSTIWGSMQERNHSSAQFVRGTFPHCIVWLKIASERDQRIQKGKQQMPFKCTKCTPESVNANILLGAVQKWCHLPRGRGVSQKLMW